MINISNKLRELRLKEKMTQKELAQKLNISFQSVSKWELGKALPSLELLIELSKIYNVSLEDILGIKIPKRRKKLMKLLDKLNSKLEKIPIEFDFIITWKDKDKKFDVSEYENIKPLGRWIKATGSSLRVVSSKERHEILEIFSLETGMSKEEIVITSTSDLYFSGYF